LTVYNVGRATGGLQVQTKCACPAKIIKINYRDAKKAFFLSLSTYKRFSVMVACRKIFFLIQLLVKKEKVGSQSNHFARTMRAGIFDSSTEWVLRHGIANRTGAGTWARYIDIAAFVAEQHHGL
jgi:hypothetical protein